MYEYFVQNPVVAFIFLALVVLVAIFLFVKAMQSIGLEKIRKIVYDGFVVAEHEFQNIDGAGKQKFEYVIQLARSSVPSPFNLFITESLLRKVIQAWFDLCKDLLDDGKLNGSKEDKGEEE